MPSCICAAVARVPFRLLAVLRDRALVVRADPFRDCVLALLDALEFVRLAPFADAVRAAFVVLRFVVLRAGRAFGACARPFAEPELAEPVRDAGFDASVLRERFAVLF